MNQRKRQGANVALITGAARRIGAAIAVHLHEAGYAVAIHCLHSRTEATILAAKLNKQRPDSAAVFCYDLMQRDAHHRLIENVFSWQNRLDLLVNNASIFRKDNADNADKLWQALFYVNAEAPYHLSQAAAAHLRHTNGSIINITDIHAKSPLKEYGIYCQSKAALRIQTKVLARELAPQIRVNAVAPGAIAWPEEANTLSGEIQKKIIAATALKRHGEPRFIAEAVLFLAKNEFITGQEIFVDGGRSL